VWNLHRRCTGIVTGRGLASLRLRWPMEWSRSSQDGVYVPGGSLLDIRCECICAEGRGAIASGRKCSGGRELCRGRLAVLRAASARATSCVPPGCRGGNIPARMATTFMLVSIIYVRGRGRSESRLSGIVSTYPAMTTVGSSPSRNQQWGRDAGAPHAASASCFAAVFRYFLPYMGMRLADGRPGAVHSPSLLCWVLCIDGALLVAMRQGACTGSALGKYCARGEVRIPGTW